MLDHLKAPRLREMRSFRRLKSAVAQLSEAIRSGNHVVTPLGPSAGA
jgi:hypothetical protein